MVDEGRVHCKELRRAVGEGEGTGRMKIVVAVEGLGCSGRGDGESGVGGYSKGIAEERQECSGMLGVHRGQECW